MDLAGSFSVVVTPSSGSAVAGVDFDATPQTVTFASGQTAATASIDVIGDGIGEASETFTVTLGSVTVLAGSVAEIGSPATATVTIIESTPPLPTGSSWPRRGGDSRGGGSRHPGPVARHPPWTLPLGGAPLSAGAGPSIATDGQVIVLERAQVEENNPGILRRYGVPFDRSENLRKKVNKN